MNWWRRSRNAAVPLAIAILALASLAGVVMGAQAASQVSQKPGSAACVSSSPKWRDSCYRGTALKGAVAVATSADGENVYVAGNEPGSVAIFKRDRATGALAQKPGPAGCISGSHQGGACRKGRGLDGAQSIVVSPDGRSVYVASKFSNAVAIFDRHPGTGELTQKPGKAGCISQSGSGGACRRANSLGSAFSVVVSPDGKSVYVASIGRRGVPAKYPLSGTISTFQRNARTGALKQDRGRAGCVSHDGDRGLCTRNPAIGAPKEIALSPDGKSLYAVDEYSNSVPTLRRNSTNGSLGRGPVVTPCKRGGDGHSCRRANQLGAGGELAISPNGRSVYLASPSFGAVVTFNRDLATGALTQKPGAAGCITAETMPTDCQLGRLTNQMDGIAVSPDGRSVYAASYTSGFMAVFSRDPANGNLTQAADAAGCVAEGGEDECQPGRAFDEVTGVSISPDGRNVYLTGWASASVAVFDRSLLP
jgi:fibronectin-binding autotransporter adhesin